jgi:hypothetical protein
MPATPRIRHMRNRTLDRSTRTDKLMVWLGAQAERLAQTPANLFALLRAPGSAEQVEEADPAPAPAPAE